MLVSSCAYSSPRGPWESRTRKRCQQPQHGRRLLLASPPPPPALQPGPRSLPPTLEKRQRRRRSPGRRASRPLPPPAPLCSVGVLQHTARPPLTPRRPRLPQDACWRRSWLSYSEKFQEDYELEVRPGRPPVRVRQSAVAGRAKRQRQGDQQADPALTGSTVWDAAIVCARFLALPATWPALCARLGKPAAGALTVWELGSGTGLLGLSCAALGGARAVLLTDLGGVVDLLQENVDINTGPGRALGGTVRAGPAASPPPPARRGAFVPLNPPPLCPRAPRSARRRWPCASSAGATAAASRRRAARSAPPPTSSSAPISCTGCPTSSRSSRRSSWPCPKAQPRCARRVAYISPHLGCRGPCVLPAWPAPPRRRLAAHPRVGLPRGRSSRSTGSTARRPWSCSRQRRPPRLRWRRAPLAAPRDRASRRPDCPPALAERQWREERARSSLAPPSTRTPAGGAVRRSRPGVPLQGRARAAAVEAARGGRPAGGG